MEIRRSLLSEISTDEIEPLIKDSFFASPGFLNLWRVRDGVGVWWTAWIDNALAAVLPVHHTGFDLSAAGQVSRPSAYDPVVHVSP